MGNRELVAAMRLGYEWLHICQHRSTASTSTGYLEQQQTKKTKDTEKKNQNMKKSYLISKVVIHYPLVIFRIESDQLEWSHNEIGKRQPLKNSGNSESMDVVVTQRIEHQSQKKHQNGTEENLLKNSALAQSSAELRIQR